MLSSEYNNAVCDKRACNHDNTLASISVTGAPIGNFSYNWDANKNKTSEEITGTMSGYGFDVGTSGYDDEDRLVGWQRDDNNLDQAWNLSLVGDWNSFTENASVQSRTHGPTHELLSVASQAVAHDAKGNQTSIPAVLRPGSSNPLAMKWDFENKLISADIDNDTVADVTYQWDALGRRVGRDDGTTATVFVQSGQQTVADYTSGTAAASPTYNYVYASYIDEPVMRTGSGGLHYFHRGQQYSIIALTGGGGTITERYAYDAYGTPTITDASGTTLTTSADNNRYTYTGREFDSELGLYHYRARMYDSVAGRFCSRDPIGYVETPNAYMFLSGKVLIGVDAHGTLTSTVNENGLKCTGGGEGSLTWTVRGDGILEGGVTIQKICFKVSTTKCNRVPGECGYECKPGRTTTARACYFERLINNSDGQARSDNWKPPTFPGGDCGSMGSAHISAWIRTFHQSDIENVPLIEGDIEIPFGGTHIDAADAMPADDENPPWFENYVSKIKTFVDFSWNTCGPHKHTTASAGNSNTGETWDSDCTDEPDPRRGF